MRLISKELFKKPNNRLEGEQEHPAAPAAPEADRVVPPAAKPGSEPAAQGATAPAARGATAPRPQAAAPVAQSPAPAPTAAR